MPALIPKIVIDTNIYISAIFWGGKPREIVELGRSGGKCKKINLSIAFEDSMTIADEDIDENWEFYRERFLKGDIL